MKRMLSGKSMAVFAMAAIVSISCPGTVVANDISIINGHQLGELIGGLWGAISIRKIRKCLDRFLRLLIRDLRL